MKRTLASFLVLAWGCSGPGVPALLDEADRRLEWGEHAAARSFVKPDPRA
jgi:hypothetical protein